MCPVPLSEDDWKSINDKLPDVQDLCDRIRLWPQMEFLSSFDTRLTARLRLSQVCFRDAGEFLSNARYGLGQSIAVRQYFLSLSNNPHDSNAVLADLRSRFYADYVSLLLYSTAEHIRVGILKFLDLEKEVSSLGKKEYAFARMVTALGNKYPDSEIHKSAKTFNESSVRESAWLYRNDWVHGKPMRVESMLYNPPRQAFVQHASEDEPWGMTLIGARVPFDYTWQQFLDVLTITLDETAKLLTICAAEWDKAYSEL